MGPSKMAAIEISWLHFSNNRSSIQCTFLVCDTELQVPANLCCFVVKNCHSCCAEILVQVINYGLVVFASYSCGFPLLLTSITYIHRRKHSSRIQQETCYFVLYFTCYCRDSASWPSEMTIKRKIPVLLGAMDRARDKHSSLDYFLSNYLTQKRQKSF